MAILASNKGTGTFKPVSAGLHPAVCCAVIDLGIQAGSERYPKPKHKVYLRWACFDEVVEWEKDGEKHSGPAIVGQTFTLSLGDNSKLRPLLESWRGKAFTPEELKGFDISTLAGVPCQLQIVHESRKEKVYANVKAIVSWPKGIPVPTFDPPVVYSPSEHDSEVFDSLPEWIRETIEERLANNYEELDQRTADPVRAAEVRAPDPDRAYNEASRFRTGDAFDDDIPF